MKSPRTLSWDTDSEEFDYVGSKEVRNTTPTSTVSVRMSVIELQCLQALAVVDGKSIAHEIRRAVIEYVKERKSEPEFVEALGDARQRLDSLLDILEVRI